MLRKVYESGLGGDGPHRTVVLAPSSLLHTLPHTLPQTLSQTLPHTCPLHIRGRHALSSFPEVRRWLLSLGEELAGRLAEDEAVHGRRAVTLTVAVSGEVGADGRGKGGGTGGGGGRGAGHGPFPPTQGSGGGGGSHGGWKANGSRSCPMRHPVTPGASSVDHVCSWSHG